MAKRDIQEINAGSMADIAFLLLIFFLVTTTMDTDTGISRVLPPMPEKDQPKDKNEVRERNVFVVLINRDDQLLVEGERLDLRDLRARTKEFFLNPDNSDDLPVKKTIHVNLIGDIEATPNAVISLQNDKGTSYKAYIQVQNELAAAVRELQNDLSMRVFGKKYDELSEEQQDAVKDVHPMAISEAEPKNVGGKS